MLNPALLTPPPFVLPPGNLITQPNLASGWSFLRGTSTQKALRSPDGRINGVSFVEDTTTNSHAIINSSAVPGLAAGTRYFSFFTKLLSGSASRQLKIKFFDTPGYGAEVDAAFDPVTGAFSGVSASGAPFSAASAWTKKYVNGWWRCTMQFTTAGNTGTDPEMLLVSGGSESYLGDGVSGIALWAVDLR